MTVMTASTPAWAVHLPAGLDPADVDLLAGGSLPRVWAQLWASEPDRAVLHTEERDWLTAGELDAASRAIAGRLHAAGLDPGDRVLMSVTSSAELVVAHVAALRLGLVVVPANPAYRDRELRHVAADARIAAALVDDPQRATWIADVVPDALVLTPDVDGRDPGRGAAPALDRAGPSDPALLIYTSGTTGVPKGAVLSHGNVLASASALGLAWRWTPADRLVLALPLFHAHGLAVGLHGTLLAGASVVRPTTLRGRRRARCVPRPRRDAVLRRPHHVRAAGGIAAPGGAGLAAVVRERLRSASRRAVGGGGRARGATHHRALRA